MLVNVILTNALLTKIPNAHNMLQYSLKVKKLMWFGKKCKKMHTIFLNASSLRLPNSRLPMKELEI
jgi:hypothetical protein